MSAKLHTKGRQWALEVLFPKLQTVPASFYVGLCTETDLAENASLGEQTELSDAGGDVGYERFVVPASVAGWTSAATGDNDRKITSITISFDAPSAAGTWKLARTWFLATTSNDSGVLIMSGPVNSGSGVSIEGGGTPYSFEIEFVWPET